MPTIDDCVKKNMNKFKPTRLRAWDFDEELLAGTKNDDKNDSCFIGSQLENKNNPKNTDNGLQMDTRFGYKWTHASGTNGHTLRVQTDTHFGRSWLPSFRTQEHNSTHTSGTIQPTLRVQITSRKKNTKGLFILYLEIAEK